MVVNYFIYIYYLIEWLVMHKYNYPFLYKQVIISCEFCQHFKYLEILLSSWIKFVVFKYFGTWIEVLNHFENLLI